MIQRLAVSLHVQTNNLSHCHGTSQLLLALPGKLLLQYHEGMISHIYQKGQKNLLIVIVFIHFGASSHRQQKQHGQNKTVPPPNHFHFREIIKKISILNTTMHYIFHFITETLILFLSSKFSSRILHLTTHLTDEFDFRISGCFSCLFLIKGLLKFCRIIYYLWEKTSW